MPISATNECTEAHWAEVYDILSDAISEAGLEANLVSNADDVGIIQKRIIQNLYDNPIVVCDVSGKNPNVMFELGLRLAFDKPTIIIKDEKTSYSFDTAPIEHLEYPRDLRFNQIVGFKTKLAEKIKGTLSKAASDSTYTTFLKNFGEFTVAKLDKREVTGQEYILEELKSLRRAIQRIDPISEFRRKRDWTGTDRDFCMGGASDAAIETVAESLRALRGISAVTINSLEHGHKHILVNVDDVGPPFDLEEKMAEIITTHRNFNRKAKGHLGKAKAPKAS